MVDHDPFGLTLQASRKMVSIPANLLGRYCHCGPCVDSAKDHLQRRLPFSPHLGFGERSLGWIGDVALFKKVWRFRTNPSIRIDLGSPEVAP